MSWQRDRSPSAGLLPVAGKAYQIRVGSLIQGNTGKLDDVWEVVDQRSPNQFDDTTPWIQVENKATGERVSVPPRPNTHPITFMVPEETVDPEASKPKLDPKDVGPRTPLTDQEQVDLLREELGATLLAVKEHDSGIIICPPFESDGRNPQAWRDHIRIAHGINLQGDEDPATLGTLHGKAHKVQAKQPFDPKFSGFPHQHPYFRDKHPFKGQDY